jgi:predicted transposase YdaD
VERTELPRVIERVSDEVVRARVDGVETILHTELQQRHEPGLPERLLVYHALLRQRHAPTPVLTLLVYLMPRRPRRPLPHEIEPTAADPQVAFRYEVFCPWERPIGVAEVARCPALAPLAILTPGVGRGELDALREAVEGSGLPREEAGDLLAVTFFVGGCRFARRVLQSLKRSGVMLQSSTYQWVLSEGEEKGLEKGRAEGLVEGEAKGAAVALRRSVVALVRKRLGAVPTRLERRLERLDAAALDALFTKLLDAESPAAVRKLLPR